MRCLALTAGLLAASSCLAQSTAGQSVRVVTDETGTYLVHAAGHAPPPAPPAPAAARPITFAVGCN